MMHAFMRFCSYAQTVWALIKADFIVFKENLHNILIDHTIVVIANLVVMGYIMPQFGLKTNYGPFLLAGLIASAPLFQAYTVVTTLVHDASGDKRMLSYLFTLPMPSWLAFIYMIITWAMRGIIVAIFTALLGKLFFSLQQPTALDAVDYFMQHNSVSSQMQFLFIIIVGSVFCATLGVWIASMIKTAARLGSVWTRFMFPLWIFGGFQFSWAAMHAVFPRAAYLNLLNPLLYITEGIRKSMLIEGFFISVWLCAGALCLSTLIFGWWGITRFKKRLDFI